MAEARSQQVQGSLGALAALPDALLSCILFLVDAASLCRLACCSKVLRVFSAEEPLWLQQALQAYHGRIKYLANWRQTALAMHPKASLYPAALAAAARPPPPVQQLQSAFLYRRWYRSHTDVSAFLPPKQHLQRVAAASLGAERFRRLFDLPAVPVVLTGAMDSWRLFPCTLEAFGAAYSSSTFQVSKPGAGGRAQMTVADYVDYMQRQTDEEPLYVFDPEFDQPQAAPQLLDAYSTPAVFDQDYSAVLEPQRPDHRWLVVGPARSGASWHADPQQTSAWNGLVTGVKRWALYPPHVLPPGVPPPKGWGHAPHRPPHTPRSSCDGSSSSSSSAWSEVSAQGCSSSGGGGSQVEGGGGAEVDDDASSSSSSESDSEEGPDDHGFTSLQWYLEVYPLLPPELKPLEVTQHPGEVIYVPGGWWHCVLNLTPTIAVTENFVSDGNLERVLRYTGQGAAAYWSNPLEWFDCGSDSWRDWRGPSEAWGPADAAGDVQTGLQHSSQSAEAASEGRATSSTTATSGVTDGQERQQEQQQERREQQQQDSGEGAGSTGAQATLLPAPAGLGLAFCHVQLLPQQPPQLCSVSRRSHVSPLVTGPAAGDRLAGARLRQGSQQHVSGHPLPPTAAAAAGQCSTEAAGESAAAIGNKGVAAPEEGTRACEGAGQVVKGQQKVQGGCCLDVTLSRDQVQSRPAPPPAATLLSSSSTALPAAPSSVTAAAGGEGGVGLGQGSASPAGAARHDALLLEEPLPGAFQEALDLLLHVAGGALSTGAHPNSSSSRAAAGGCFLRSRLLGRWMRLLWQQHPALRPQLLAIAQQRFGYSSWEQLAQVILSAAAGLGASVSSTNHIGWAAPHSNSSSNSSNSILQLKAVSGTTVAVAGGKEAGGGAAAEDGAIQELDQVPCFPVCGSTGCVLLFQGICIKLLLREAAWPALLMAQTEALCCQLLQERGHQEQHYHPDTITGGGGWDGGLGGGQGSTNTRGPTAGSSTSGNSSSSTSSSSQHPSGSVVCPVLLSCGAISVADTSTRVQLRQQAPAAAAAIPSAGAGGGSSVQQARGTGVVVQFIITQALDNSWLPWRQAAALGTTQQQQQQQHQQQQQQEGAQQPGLTQQQQREESQQQQPQVPPHQHPAPPAPGPAALAVQPAAGSSPQAAPGPAQLQLLEALAAALVRVHRLPLPAVGPSGHKCKTAVVSGVQGSAGGSSGCSTGWGGVSNREGLEEVLPHQHVQQQQQQQQQQQADQEQHLQQQLQVCGLVLQGTWWHDREGNTWSSQLGHIQGQPSSSIPSSSSLGSMPSAAQASQPASRGIPGSTQVPLPLADKRHHLQQQQLGEGEQQQQQLDLVAAVQQLPARWRPFATFLCHRLQQVVREAEAGWQDLCEGNRSSSGGLCAGGVAAARLAAAAAAAPQDAGSDACQPPPQQQQQQQTSHDITPTRDSSCGATTTSSSSSYQPAVPGGELVDMAASGDDLDGMPLVLLQQLPRFLQQQVSALLACTGTQQQQQQQQQLEQEGSLQEVVGVAEQQARDGGSTGLQELPEPCWCHGDVMADNVYACCSSSRAAHRPVPNSSSSSGLCACDSTAAAGALQATGQEQSAQAHLVEVEEEVVVDVRLLDFADAGQGDPLFDMVAVAVSCCSCNMAWFRAFLSAYIHHWGAQGTAPGAASNGTATTLTNLGTAAGVPLSRVFLVYLLLHEEEPWEEVAEVYQQAIRSCSSWERVAEVLYGWMDGLL